MIMCCPSLIVLIIHLSTVIGQFSSATCENREMACYIDEKCYTGRPNAKAFLIAYNYDDKKDCDLYVQIRQYSESHAFVRLASKEKSILIATGESDSNVVFGCRESKGVIEGVKPEQKNLSFSNWKTGISCEFEFRVAQGKMLSDDHLFVFFGSQSVEAEDLLQNAVKDKAKCDNDWLDSMSNDDVWAFFPVDKRFNDVKCISGELAYKSGEKIKTAEKISCIKQGSGKKSNWHYEIREKANSPPDVIVDRENYSTQKVGVACRVKGCKQCSGQPPECESVPTCPKVTEEKGCDFKTCPNGLIQVDNSPVQGELSCAKADDGVFKWTLKGKTVEKTTCITGSVCQAMNKIDCGGDCKGLEFDQDGKKSKCKNGKITITGGEEGLTANSIECNKEEMQWYADVDGMNTPLDKGVKVKCEKGGSSTGSEQQTASAGSNTILYAVTGVLAVVAVAGVAFAICYCCVLRPKKIAKSKMSKKAVNSPKKRATTESSKVELATAIPLPPTVPVAVVIEQPKDKEDRVELVEKTMIAMTPITPASKKTSIMMKTAVLPISEEEKSPPVDFGNSPPVDLIMEGRITGEEERQEISRVERVKKREQSGEKNLSQSQSEAVTFTNRKGEAKKKKKSGETPQKIKPKEFELNEKEKKIQKGATVKKTEYPTLAEILSDWDDKDAKAEAEKIKQKQKVEAAKTVPAAVTAEHPDKTKLDPTQITKNTIDAQPKSRKSVKEITKLITQLETANNDNDSGTKSGMTSTKKKI